MHEHRAETLPTGTVTFLITDIEGSTALLLDAGERYAEILQRHDQLVRCAVADHGGTTVSTAGDSVFAVFAGAAAAVAAAVAAQSALASEPWPDGHRVAVRMGLHTGEGTLGGADYIGLDVHRTARISAAAHGGQVVVSAATAALLPAGEAPLIDLGVHRLKDLTHPEHLYQVVVPGGAERFPPLRSLGGVRVILPVPRTSFVPRPEVAAVAELLRSSPVVTLTGPGGTGKTRLALEVARRGKEEFPDGVLFVDLSPLRDPDLVAVTVLRTMGLEPGGVPARQRLVQALQGSTALLILDNCEQVVAGTDVVVDLLAGAPGLRVLATSRSPLHLAGEQEFPVPPLALPEPGADPSELPDNPAVRLFVDRARRVDPGFAVSSGNADALVAIAEQLDGLPLALELAAARVRLLPPTAIAERLAITGAAELAAPDRDVPERQRTMDAAVSWSYELLSPDAKTAFRRWAAFVGGARLAEIRAVLGLVEADLLDVLTTLVEQSLLRRDDAAGAPRFGMLRTIGDFAEARLAEDADRAPVLQRHTDAYLGLAEQAAPHLTGWDQREWLDLLERDHDNMRAAFDRSLAAADAESSLRLVVALWRFWQIRGHLDEAATRIDRALALPCPDPVLRASALEAAGGIAWWRGEIPRAREAYAEALAIVEPVGDLRTIANARYNLALVLGFDDRDDRSRREMERARSEAREAGDRRVEAWAVWGLSDIGVSQGDWMAAAASGEQALAMFRELDDPFGIGWSLFMTATSDARLPQGDKALARERFREAIRLFAGFGDVSALAMHARSLARLEAASGRFDRALRLVGASQALRQRAGVGLLDVNEALLDAFDPVTTEALAAADRSREDIERLIGEGAALSPHEAVSYVLEELAEPAGPAD
jgi:predicted ATPase/class 3 adenylate cyclase